MKNLNSLLDYIKAIRYNIGFVKESVDDVINGKPITVNWLKHSYKDRWFADPFILDVTDDEFVVLVEEWYDPIQRGRISKLIVDRNTYELKSLKVMIDEGFHMSFPAITRKLDGIYIQPECGATHRLVEYKYNEEQDLFEKKNVICDLPLTDSVRNTLFNEDLMFSTKLPDANGKELGIYYWNKSQSRYQIKDYYHFQENLSRMAGNFFVCNGKIYRPAQVCIDSYGDAVSIQETKYSQGKYEFKEIRRIYSPHPDYNLGFHTFNEYNGFVVVDAVGYRKPMLCRFIRKMKQLLC
jgi:hypothetical protein